MNSNLIKMIDFNGIMLIIITVNYSDMDIEWEWEVAGKQIRIGSTLSTRRENHHLDSLCT